MDEASSSPAVASAPDALRDADRLLAGCLAGLHGNFSRHAQSLYLGVHAAHRELRAGDPTVAQADLPVWSVTDDEDVAIARAAGTDLVGVVRRTALGVVVIAAMVGFICTV